MKLIEKHDYRFPSHLLPALVNNEPVIDEDRESFYAFLDKLEQHKIKYHATGYFIDYDLESYFSWTNCLNNLGCDVTEIRVNFIR